MCAEHHCDIGLCGCDADAQYADAQSGKHLSGAQILAQAERHAAKRAREMPTEADCLRVLMDAYSRLKELGWNDAIYCPKDGSIFDSIGVGSTGIHPCHYEGKWPDGSWWVHEAHDLWPAQPILWRASREATARKDER